MKRPAPVLALTLCALFFGADASAQTPAAKPAAKPVAKPAAKPAVRKPTPVEAPLPKAEGEQLAAAALTYYGDYGCEFGQTVSILTTPNHDGYVDVRLKTQTWTMKPVLSSTGALRLEDVKGRMLMIQIANKSMLMDTRLGQRVVDECVHETQRAAIAKAAEAAAAASQPASTGLLSAPPPASAPAGASPPPAPVAAPASSASAPA